MRIDASATETGMNELRVRLNDAMRNIVADALADVRTKAQDIASTFTGDYPNRSSTTPGTLRNSIIVDGPYEIGDGRYRGATGPLVVYGAQREFGGEIRPKPGNYKGMTFWFEGRWWRGVKRVYQQEYPQGRYLSPAGRMVQERMNEIVEKRLNQALEGM
jgi:hypothetical protein